MQNTCAVQLLIKGQSKHIESFIAYLAMKTGTINIEVLNDEEIPNGFVNLSGYLKESANVDIIGDNQLVKLTEHIAVEIYTQIANDNSVPGILAGYDEHAILRNGKLEMFETDNTKSYFTEDFILNCKPNTVEAFNAFANSDISEDDFENGMYVKHGGFVTDDEDGIEFTI